MNHRELIIVLNDAFFKTRHEDKRYRKGWVDAFMTVENDVNTAFAKEAVRLAASMEKHTTQHSEPVQRKPSEEHNAVSHPSYYCEGGIETLDFILAKKMDFLLGQVCKYIVRAGKKNPKTEVEDLEKARFYLDRKIRLLKEGRKNDAD